RAIRPAYMARRARYFAEEASIFADVLTEGRTTGEFDFENPLSTAQMLLLATNSLLPSSLSTRELGERTELEAKVSAIASLLLDGLIDRLAAGSKRPRSQTPRRRVMSGS